LKILPNKAIMDTSLIERAKAYEDIAALSRKAREVMKSRKCWQLDYIITLLLLIAVYAFRFFLFTKLYSNHFENLVSIFLCITQLGFAIMKFPDWPDKVYENKFVFLFSTLALILMALNVVYIIIITKNFKQFDEVSKIELLLIIFTWFSYADDFILSVVTAKTYFSLMSCIYLFTTSNKEKYFLASTSILFISSAMSNGATNLSVLALVGKDLEDADSTKIERKLTEVEKTIALFPFLFLLDLAGTVVSFLSYYYADGVISSIVFQILGFFSLFYFKREAEKNKAKLLKKRNGLLNNQQFMNPMV
jgi:Ca2+/Na+ antiporter